MTFQTNVSLDKINAAANEATATVLTEGTIITVNAERFDALRNAGLLAIIDHTPMGWPLYGVERDFDDMVTCVIADLSAIAERAA